LLIVAYIYRFPLCEISIGANPNVKFCRDTSNSSSTFGGTWQGSDAYDASTITITLTQNGNNLTGTLSDTFTQRADGTKLPGASGNGSGTLLSPTEAEMTFQLVRSDGDQIEYKVHLRLNNSNTIVIEEESTILLRQ